MKIKVEVIKEFTYEKNFKELKNIVRKISSKNKEGCLYLGDTFECPEETAKYFLNEENSIYLKDKDGKNNPKGVAFVRTAEVIVDEEKPKTKKKTTLNKRKSLDK